MASTSQKKKTATSIDFEKDLAQLERIIADMEKGDFSLEETVTQFEQGMKLVKSCQRALHEAEQKVSMLIKKDRDFALEDFEESRKK